MWSIFSLTCPEKKIVYPSAFVKTANPLAIIITRCFYSHSWAIWCLERLSFKRLRYWTCASTNRIFRLWDKVGNSSVSESNLENENPLFFIFYLKPSCVTRLPFSLRLKKLYWPIKTMNTLLLRYFAWAWLTFMSEETVRCSNERENHI